MMRWKLVGDAAGTPMLAGLIEGEAPGAIPCGARVRKCSGELGDGTPIGTGGVVLASHPFTAEMEAAARAKGVTEIPSFLYFVEWDNRPGMPIGVTDWKLEPA